jgi:hypothetical protein
VRIPAITAAPDDLAYTDDVTGTCSFLGGEDRAHEDYESNQAGLQK